MEGHQRKIVAINIIWVFLLFSSLSFASSDQYAAMKGVDSVNVIFDVRDGNPQSAALHLNLILDTYKNLVDMEKKPVFVVVFMAGAVKLISSDHSGFDAEGQKSLQEIAGILSKMSAEGIRIEVCLFAARLFGVESGTILPEVKQLPNGWISEIGYQARGYSLVPVY